MDLNPTRKNTGVTRRVLLQTAGAASTGLALLSAVGCRQAREQARLLTGPAAPDWKPLPHDANKAEQAVHVLNRAAYGPRPGDVSRVAGIGAAAYVEEQLADVLDEDPTSTWRVNGLDTQQATQDAPDLLSSMPDDQLLTETQQAAILRAVYSRHQLREVLADFWTNHFNIYALKNDGRVLIPIDTERAIRPHLLGSFREMLLASARSPAMLAYLDNNQNRSGKANENYAREVLELHTLGVHSGYTQHDIQEVARCFTGWTVKTGFQRGQFVYDETLHDDGAKFIPFLNLHIVPRSKADGEQDAATVLEALALHPATAHFVAGKLCRRFLGCAPDDVVAQAAAAYVKHNSDIRATLRPILLDALLRPADNKPVFKRPLELTASALRALAADTDGGPDVQQHLAAMGQPLYQWPMPDGFPEKETAWTASLLPRWNFAFALAGNALNGTSVDLNAVHSVGSQPSDTVFVDTLLEAVANRSRDIASLQSTRQQITRHVEQARRDGVPQPQLLAEATGLLLASPPFQWR